MYWVRKEAVLKATGCGLLVPLSAVTISGPDEAARLMRWEADVPAPTAVALADLTVRPGYVGCVAALSDGPLQLNVADATAALRPAAST